MYFISLKKLVAENESTFNTLLTQQYAKRKSAKVTNLHEKAQTIKYKWN